MVRHNGAEYKHEVLLGFEQVSGGRSNCTAQATASIMRSLYPPWINKNRVDELKGTPSEDLAMELELKDRQEEQPVHAEDCIIARSRGVQWIVA